MSVNGPIYLVFTAYLACAAWYLWRGRIWGLRDYGAYLLLLIPAFLMVWAGMIQGSRNMPKYQLSIHGYRVDNGSQNAFSLGSDPSDQIRLHYTHRGREMFDGNFLQIQIDGREVVLQQNDLTSPNIVSLDGLPLRALELVPGIEQRISFKAFDYRQDDAHTVKILIRKGIPQLTYRGQTFVDGYSRDLFWGLVRLPYANGTVRHIAYNDRLLMDGSPRRAEQLFAQAALVRHKGRYYLAANDAQIRLDGKAFPNRARLRDNTKIRVATREIGSGRRAVDFKLIGGQQGDPHAYLQLDPHSHRRFVLPDDLASDRLCLSASESIFSRTYDIIDPQFPARGLILNREGGRFVFRGDPLVSGQIYQAGNAAFSLTEARPQRFYGLAFFASLFLLTACLVPPRLLRQTPSSVVLLSAIALLLAFRQILAFRAWLGPPFKVSTLMDSMTAPFLVFAIITALTARLKLGAWCKRHFLKVWNFFLPTRQQPLPPSRPIGDAALVGVLLYGFALYFSFALKLGFVFAMILGVVVAIAVMAEWLEKQEDRAVLYANLDGEQARWAPAKYLWPLFGALVLAAPLLGGREVIALVPGRPRPDIFIQIFLLFLAAYFAGIWFREASRRVPNLWTISLSFAVILVPPLIQGLISRDMGFFVMVGVPLACVMVLATWQLDVRLRVLMVVGLVFAALSPYLLKTRLVNLDKMPLRRVAFTVDPQRVKAEYFHDYLAHLPMLWAGNQGFTGGGYFRGDWYSAIGETSVNDNVASVFIQGELGALGTWLVILTLALVGLAALVFLRRQGWRGSGFRPWFVLAVALSLIWTGATMFVANLGYFPLTGKNLPFLGLDSLNDALRYALLIGLMLRQMQRIAADKASVH